MGYQVYNHKKKIYQNQYQFDNDFDRVIKYHQSLKEYKVTPLYSLKDFSKKYQIKAMYVKDESHRFGLNAFKGLGVSFAASSRLQDTLGFVSCTDGNHGKALAWFGMNHHIPVIIFMPKGSEDRRIKAIEKYHARVIVTDYNYDDTVRYAYDYAIKNGYTLIQDTALENYYDIPGDIVMGYTTLVQEAYKQMKYKPTHVFLQAGVGSFAGGITWYLANHDHIPYIGVMESSSCPCIYESVKQDTYYKVGGHPHTIMAGLNCGEANPMTLPILSSYVDWFVKCDDDITVKGMTRAKHPIGDDQSYSSGESGAVSLGLVETILNNDRELFRIDEDSVILVINTEGELS